MGIQNASKNSQKKGRHLFLAVLIEVTFVVNVYYH